MSEIKLSAKKLGFGLMRLPKNGEAIDIEQVKKMVDLFMAAGFTYFDTAGPIPDRKTRSVRRSSSVIRAKSLRSPRKTPPGSTARAGKTPSASSRRR